ncbi:M20/M25/M40 family metallo-hydrolase [Fangia hongkongensis]|uniref:M20/M25/M40 family metallo-hydrolase n=1 Tax=Fangia hongkongensis TaxID=270495 RepID=UPI000373E892|nr:M20/M25/M40 family metallo-hydrolase [Fangia hongkongensis]MBK2125568.1 M20/M25/M40 family metallo-hydrolase [Fangia hongkongensis]
MSEKLNEAVGFLTGLIEIPSLSTKEDKSAEYIYNWMEKKALEPKRIGNNVYAKSKHFDPDLPSVLLVSHHDTVPPAKSYTKDPFKAEIIDGKLYGLGANDAGGALSSMLIAYERFSKEKLGFNLVFCAAAEEEVSGVNGLSLALKEMGKIDFAFVGEPTSLEAAISEKGLMVCDCVAFGQSGHAARDEGVNAIDIALKDISWLHSYQFENKSKTLGDVKMSATVIQAGSQHNVVPDKCHFVVDVRTTDCYNNEAVLNIMQSHMQAVVTPRSMRIKPSSTPSSHPILALIQRFGIKTYGSPTTSDQAVLSCPSIKISPGDSKRSHSADEYIYIQQIDDGIHFFMRMIEALTLESDTLQSYMTNNTALDLDKEK